MPAARPDLTPDFAPLLAERHVALAVSGGSDSTAMMRLAAHWARTFHPGLALSVLTVDHRLRPEAAGEALRVKGWATDIGLSHATLSWDDEPKPATGLQARARAARYDLMARWCRANAATVLLTAHTLDDQAETVLMRLQRTLSPASLAGIRIRGDWQGLALHRPMIGLRRQALRDWLAGEGAPWIEDPSNADPRFERVRVRNALALPGAEGVTPERLAALAARSAKADELLERMARRWIALWLREEEAGVCHVEGADFATLPAALQARILGRIVAHYGGGQGAPEAEELRRLAEWAAGGEGAVRRTLAGAIIGRRRKGFWVTREAARIAPDPLIVPEAGRALWDRRFHVAAPPGSRITAAAGRNPGLGSDVLHFARLAYPWVETPPGTGQQAEIGFVCLKSGPV